MGHWLVHRLSSGGDTTAVTSLLFDKGVEFLWISIAGDNVLDIVAFISGILLQPFVSVKIVWVIRQASLAEGPFHPLGYSLQLLGDPGLAVSWEDNFDGILASINSRYESLKRFHKSLMLVWFVLSWVKELVNMFISALNVSVSGFFHRNIFFRGGLFLVARVLVSANTMS